jgi:glycosyltransferase involved in cell wall biosynthesis
MNLYIMTSAYIKNIIYIASPWGAAGGGMYKVSDYLIQTHKKKKSNYELLGLDTRGNKTVAHSFWYLLISLVSILRGKLSGKLVGVHVNMAERLSVFRKGIIILFCKLIGVPTILHLHAAQFPIFYNSIPRFLKFLVRGLFKLPQKVIVLGATAQKFVTSDLRVKVEKVEVIPNGVPSASLPRRKFDSSKNFEILFLGNLTERKGVTDLLKAINSKVLLGEQGFILRLAGGGNIENYKTYVSENRLDNFVQFEGWVDQQSASKLLANADVLILPSYDEGLPLVILEAMANSVAVICTPVGEIANFLKDEVNAIFVAPGDMNALCTAISRFQNDSTFREKVEQVNLVYFDRFFSLEKFYQTMQSSYRVAFNSSQINSPVA